MVRPDFLTSFIYSRLHLFVGRAVNIIFRSGNFESTFSAEFLILLSKNPTNLQKKGPGMLSALFRSFLFFLLCLVITGNLAFSAVPVTPNASPESRALLNFLYATYGNKILSGQMYAPWGIDEISTVYSITGKYPAISGHDFINESQNNGEVTKAINYWRDGGIVTFMWHQGAPTVGEGYDASLGTQPNFNNLFVSGTNENRELLSDYDRIAAHLKKLQDANVPVIWRPYHECSGGWFWWDKNGGEGFQKLWRYMFDYFTKIKGLNNLIWFLGYDGSPDIAYNPGEGYYDLVGGDTYGSGQPYANIFNSCRSIHGNSIPVALHECGTLPNPDQCQNQGVTWMWWMLWHTGHLSNHNQTDLKNYYNHDFVLTRDELPDIMTYLDGNICTPSNMTPYLKINNNPWQQNSSATVSAGSTVMFGPQPSSGGSWKWSGPQGFSASGREVEISQIREDQAGDYLAVYVNAGGCTTQTTFSLTVELAVKILAGIRNARPDIVFENRILKINSSVNGRLSVSVYDLHGRLAYFKTVTGMKSIPVSSLLPMGSYIFEVNNNGKALLRQKILISDR
jgi:hypothetical protein